MFKNYDEPESPTGKRGGVLRGAFKIYGEPVSPKRGREAC